MSCDEKIKTILAALIIVFSWSLAGSAIADQGDTEGPIWLWSESSPKSNASAVALGNGDMGRGLRLAKSALKAATDKRDRLIAHHNLCVAHAARFRTEHAVRHCQATRRLADDGFFITQGEKRVSASHILEANLASLGVPELGKLP